ncbi:L2 protein [Papillomaviridae sp. Haddock_c2655]|nr:L2 protein [Papillomaviridae sp. Haddock_c2655]
MLNLLLFLESTSMDSPPPTIHKRTKRANVNEFPVIEPWPEKVARWLSGFLYIGGGPTASEAIVAAISESVVAPHFIPAIEPNAHLPITPTVVVRPVEPISIPLEPLRPYVPDSAYVPPVRVNPFTEDLPDLPNLDLEPSLDPEFGPNRTEVDPWIEAARPTFEVNPKDGTVHIHRNDVDIVNEPDIFHVEIPNDVYDEVIENPFAGEEFVPPRTSTPRGQLPKPRGKPLQRRGERFELVHMHAFENPMNMEEDVGIFDAITDIDGLQVTPGEGRNLEPDEFFESTSGIISRVWKGYRQGMATRSGVVNINTRVVMEIDPIIEIEMEPLVPQVDERLDQTLFSDSEAVAQSGRRADTRRMVEQRQQFKDNYTKMNWDKPIKYDKKFFQYGLSKEEGSWIKSGPFKFSSEEGFQLDILGEDYRPAVRAFPITVGPDTPDITHMSWTPDEPPEPTPIPQPYIPLEPAMHTFNDTVFSWDEMISEKKCKRKKKKPYSCISDASRKTK